jgi:tetratricopeptide (TPR) repeat protein
MKLMDRQIAPIPERLLVFVSSSIRECPEERGVSKKAITSLNHEALLFEHAGARPYTSQTWYFRKIDEAHIFVGIYRKTYGYVAPGMSISGIEDEFHRALLRGMPCLYYVHNDSGPRDPRLQKLIEQMQLAKKICFYRDPTEIYDRLREDITAVLAESFHKLAQSEAMLHTGPLEAVRSILPDENILIRRADIEASINIALQKNYPVQITGPAGIGKTVLLASMAASNGYIFVSGAGLSRKQVAEAIGSKLSSQHSRQFKYCLNADEAYTQLVGLWNSLNAFTIVLDDCPDIKFILDFLKDVGGVDNKRKLIYSEREPTDVPSHTRVVVPPLSTDEARQIIRRLRGDDIPPDLFQRLIEIAGGNPLFLRYYAAVPSDKIPSNLTDLETQVLDSLPPRGREIVEYLSVWPGQLSQEELLQLIEDTEASTGQRPPEIGSIRFLIREDTFGYSILHDHLRQTVLSSLESRARRYAYVAQRVAGVLIRRKDFAEAYLILQKAGERQKATSIAPQAQFDAAKKGDLKTLVFILEQDLSTSDIERSAEQNVMIYLSLSEARQGLGLRKESQDALREATRIAASFGDSALQLKTREVSLIQSTFSGLTSESIEELQNLKIEYERIGDTWSSARLDLQLSAISIRLDRYADAKRQANFALAAFSELGDEHGISLARRNLASALSALPGEENNLADLLNTLEQAPSTTMRERAWLCNLMVRRFRKARDFRKAKEYALEAIEIGQKLGDSYLTALNKLSLGSVLRNEGKLDEALKMYGDAASDAQKSANTDIEATSSRIMASVYNQKGSSALAIQHALYAISLVRGTIFADEIASSFEELGDAYRSLNQEIDAARSYAEAASAFSKQGDKEETQRLGLEALRLFGKLDADSEYIQVLDTIISDVVTTEPQNKPIGERLLARLSQLLAAVDRTYAIPIFGSYTSQIYKGVPDAVGRFLFRQISNSMLKIKIAGQEWRSLFALIPLLVCPGNRMNIADLAEIGEKVNDFIGGLHFRPCSDGSGHWVATLNLGESVICSVATLDSRVETSISAALIVLFLKGFEHEIRDKVLPSIHLGRNEIAIEVGSSESMPDDIRKHIEPDLQESDCVVSRATDPKGEIHYPTYVFCRSNIAEHWQAGSDKGSSLQLLLGLTLIEIVFQLLSGEVDLSSLKPKIMKVIRQTVF